jgi:hypothetical protein
MADASRMEIEDSEADSEDETSVTEMTKPEELKVESCKLPVSESTRTISAADMESRLESVLKENVDWTSVLVQ